MKVAKEAKLEGFSIIRHVNLKEDKKSKILIKSQSDSLVYF